MKNYSVSNAQLGMTLDIHDARAEVTLSETGSGRTWGPVSLVELEAYSKAEFRAEWLQKYRIDAVETFPDRLHIVFSDEFRGIRAALWLILENSELVVRMTMPEVYEDRPNRYRLFSLRIMPGLMSASSAGRMLVPLNSGAICYPKDKPELADRFMLYGEQSRWELLPTLPVCAVMNPDGGMMALATGAAAETEVHVRTDGAGSGTVGFGMNLRQNWPDPVEFSTRELRYRPLAKGADLLMDVATRLRRHITEDLGKPTLKARCAECPDLAYMMRAYTMKLFFGVENNGIMMYGSTKGSPVTFRNVMTFDECSAHLKRLHAGGVKQIYTQSVGFNPNGHDGMWPTAFPIDERLGGEKKFREMIALGKSLGYRMHVHDNELSLYERSPEWDAELVMQDQWGNLLGLGEWGGGIHYVPHADLWSTEVVAGRMRKLKDLGLDGMGYLDGMGNPLYRDYHPRHKLTRTGYANMTNRLIRIAQQVHGSAGTECGFLYCAAVADSLCTGGEEWHWKLCWPTWPVTRLMDERVPLWFLTMHGLVFHENQGIGWTNVMNMVLFGGHPRDEWSARPGVMPIMDDKRVASIKAIADIALDRFGHLQAEFLTAYEKMADGVQRTRFADGTEVTADFKTGRLTVNGAEVARPACL